MNTEMVLPNLLRARAIEQPDRIFLEHVDGSQMSYGELEHRASLWSGALNNFAVKPEATVIAMMPTCFEAISVWMGIARLRAIEVPVNTGFRGRMLEYILSNSKADVMIIHEEYVERFRELPDAVAGKTLILTGGSPDGFTTAAKVVMADEVLVPFEPGPELTSQPHDVSTIMYTSGTTGPSKGVLVTWAHALASGFGCFPEEDFDENDVWYGPYPLFHVSGKAPIYAFAAFNAKVVIREIFSTRDFWEDIRRHGCTSTLLMGATAVFLESQPTDPRDREHCLDKVLMSPLPDDVVRFKERFGVRVRTVFNMTEISCPIQSSWDLVDGRSCGRVMPGYQCQVVDHNDYPVPPGTLGELVVRADDPWVLMAGYWGLPEKTVEAWRNLWFHTGDGFTYDENGNFYFVDRRKDAIRRRGENISSMEVEAEINVHPDVMESAVIAVPSEWGEDEVMALIIRREGSDLQAQALYEYLMPKMARFMLPRYIRFVHDLPKTPTSKVRKTVLRDEGITPDTWDHDAVMGSRRNK
jgi:crotonobetaine/carnitine-CoA ligase